jgi:hypothetical protein
VGQVHRLQTCRSCHHLFVSERGERLCPDCRRSRNRDRFRRRPWGGGAASGHWRPLAAFAIGAVGLSFLAALTNPGWMGLAGWVGGAAAIVYVARTTF